MKVPHSNKKQTAIAYANERRKATKRLQLQEKQRCIATASAAAVISKEMVDQRIERTCIDRIKSFLPKYHKPPPFSGHNNDRGRDRTIEVTKLLPYRPLKRNVLWMSMKEQDASSTMTLTEELESFADYVSVSSIKSDKPSNKHLQLLISFPRNVCSWTLWKMLVGEDCWRILMQLFAVDYHVVLGCRLLDHILR